MILLRRAAQRHNLGFEEQSSWLTFKPPSGKDQGLDHFGSLSALNEHRVPPGAIVAPYPSGEAEIITYVHRGILAQNDSRGRSDVIRAGEFHRVTTGNGIRINERNASQETSAHFFRISLHPIVTNLDGRPEQQHFPVAQRRGRLCIVASQDGRKGSLRLQQDALLFSAVLTVGHHLVHELSQHRMAWLHIVAGEVVLGDLVLAAGDGVGLATNPSVSFTALEESEILLLDLCHQPLPSLGSAEIL
ncbi:MAG: pirin family protein [Myxococcota bacterium]|jgi:hypothetical protein|nr:pirin family protein [Myxococcota bacterium]